MSMTASNWLTIARAVGAVILFLFLWLFKKYDVVWMLYASFPLFVASAFTDFLDGALARRWKQETVFGRIADPFVDKILVCGTFIFLLYIPASLVTPWLLIIIVGRELLVSGIRSYAEGRGIAFGAMWSGKIKVTSQYITIGWILFYLAHLKGVKLAESFTLFCVYAISVITAASAITYIHKAIKLLKGTDVA